MRIETFFECRKHQEIKTEIFAMTPMHRNHVCVLYTKIVQDVYN